MRVLTLTTWTDCENKHRSLTSVGHDVDVVQYDDRPHDRHGEIVEHARQTRPDAIVMIGAVEQYHGRPVLRSDTLKAMREVAPTILMCNDAADPPWWPTLEEYHAAEAFTLYVSIDGSFDNPIATYSDGMLALTPTDWRPFNPLPWEARDIRCGMVGGLGHRQGAIEQMQQRGALTFMEGPGGRSYNEFASIMCRTKITFCCGKTGSGARQHVKGRMIEAGLAGSAALEMTGSPAARWFEPGVDYLEYGDVEDAIRTVNEIPDDAVRVMAARYSERMWREHHPAVFWKKVFERVDSRFALDVAKFEGAING